MQKCFAKLSADLQMGLPVSEAFQRMADDCGNEDAQDVALAIAVQDTVGGHEADVVLSIAKNIEERIMMRRKLKVFLLQQVRWFGCLILLHLVLFCTFALPVHPILTLIFKTLFIF